MADLAEVADECIHGLTTAWCSLCKADTRRREGFARRRRASVDESWTTHPSSPYPSTKADYPSNCKSCGDRYDVGDTIYRAASMWVCGQCKDEYETLGVGPDDDA